MASEESEKARRSGPRLLFAGNGAWGAALFVFLLAVYQVNCDILPGGDGKSSAYVAVGLLRHGCPTVTPHDAPSLFKWRLQTPAGAQRAQFNTWADMFWQSVRRPAP